MLLVKIKGADPKKKFYTTAASVEFIYYYFFLWCFISLDSYTFNWTKLSFKIDELPMPVTGSIRLNLLQSKSSNVQTAKDKRGSKDLE